MSRRSKRMREIDAQIEGKKFASLAQIIEQLQSLPKVKFDQSVDVSLKLGVDPRKADQSVRGIVTLPHGTGKTIRVLVFARGEKAEEALRVGAEFAGFEEYFPKVRDGWTDFDAVIATPDMMREVGKLGKVLGPRGLMPTPKAGTVTNNVAETVEKIKAGQVEFKVDPSGVINNPTGKLSFSQQALTENIRTILQAIVRARPPGARGQYMKSLTISCSMGPGLRADLREFASS